jgi:hypothetical protein
VVRFGLVLFVLLAGASLAIWLHPGSSRGPEAPWTGTPKPVATTQPFDYAPPPPRKGK